MVLPIGFFMPLPLAMMIPFMGIQSSVMAKQFGENFQYGKRRISAMSNEEFNKLTPKILQENANAELKAMIPSMEASISEMRQFQTFLIGEFIRMIGDMLTAGLGKILGITDTDQALQDVEHFLHGHFDLHKGTVSQEDDTTKFVAPTITTDKEYTMSTIITAAFQYTLTWSNGVVQTLNYNETKTIQQHKDTLIALRDLKNDAYVDMIFKLSKVVHDISGIWI